MAQKLFRELMVEAMRERGMSMAELQRRSGVGYDVINKLKRGDNRSTSAENAQKLAEALGITNMPSLVHIPNAEAVETDSGDRVSIYNVQASAGHGAVVPDHEEIVDRLAFPPGYLRTITKARPADLAIITVKGESMLPTLSDNDVVMVDTSKTDTSFDGLFVLRDDGASLLVKRVTRGSRKGTIMLISDNKAYPTVERDKADIEIVGKVVWMGVRV